MMCAFIVGIPSVGFSLNGVPFYNGSTVLRTDIGEGDNALLCTTDRRDCCGTFGNRAGEFYFPDGTQVPIQGAVDTAGYYRNRGDQFIRLNRQSPNGVLTGQFRCGIPIGNQIPTDTNLFIDIGTYKPIM